MSSTAEPHSGQGLLMVLAGIAAGGTVAFAMNRLGVEPEPAAAIASGAALLPPAAVNSIQKRRRGRSAELRALSHGHLIRPVPTVIAIVAATLVLIFNALLWTMTAIVGIGPAVADHAITDRTIEAQVSVATLLVVFPLFLVATFAVASRACHYLSGRRYLWLLCSVLLFWVLLIAIDVLTGQFDPQTLIGAVAGTGVLFGIAALGARWGMKSHDAYVAGRLLRKLAPEDRGAVTAMIGEAVDAQLSPAASPPVAGPLPQAPPDPGAPR